VDAGQRAGNEQAMAQAARLYGAGRIQEARALCDAILQGDPKHFWALHLAATIALRERDFERCIALATRALDQQPANAEVLSNRGAAFRRMNRIEEALADYDRALAADPKYVPALINRGVALAALNRHAHAIASYDRALALQPGNTAARYHRALSHLVTGNLEQGFQDYEARYGGWEGQAPRRATRVPEWTGREALAGRSILVHAEQGLGDSIQMMRYAPLLQGRGATVHLEVPATLREIAKAIPGVSSVTASGEAAPATDFHLPMMSLPRAFETRLDSIPGGVPYIVADPVRVGHWRERLPRGRARIGVAWSGNPAHVNDSNRSLSLAALAPLASLGAEVVVLQKDLRPGDAEMLHRLGWRHFSEELAGFSDTAALAACVDRVITVDTSIAHLAGAMGLDTWVLLPFSPDWRFLLDREDSPWYPTMRLFRQAAPGAWAPLIQVMSAAMPRVKFFDGPPPTIRRRLPRDIRAALRAARGVGVRVSARRAARAGPAGHGDGRRSLRQHGDAEFVRQALRLRRGQREPRLAGPLAGCAGTAAAVACAARGGPRAVRARRPGRALAKSLATSARALRGPAHLIPPSR